jgi:hypothetical protein
MITAKEFLKRHEWTEDYEEILREFAILHVEAALEAAHINHQLPIEDLEFTLDCYPLTNIK